MIINISHTKGGVGKSTLACNLAVEMKLPILDLDMQKSSYYFNEIRKQSLKGLEVFHVKTLSEMDLLDKFAEDQHNHIIVDSGGMDNDLHRLALLMADIIITPVGTSQIELLGLENFYSILERSNLDLKKEYVLLNQINPRGKKEVEMIESIIREDFKLNLLDSVISSRKIFKDAFSEGKSVVEKDKTSLASKEIKNLIKEIKGIIKKE